MDIIWNYIKRLARKWIVWMFLALDVLGVIVVLYNPQIQLPVGLYWVFAALGIAVGGFQIHLDDNLYSAHNSPSVRPKEEIKPMDSVKQVPIEPLKQAVLENSTPPLAISIVEGSEYNFKILEIHQSRRYEIASRLGTTNQFDPRILAMRRAVLSLNIRLENKGNSPLDILSIDTKHPYIEGIWSIDGPFVWDEQNKEFEYPKTLNINEGLLCHISFGMEPEPHLNPAQFAVRFSEEYPDRVFISVTIKVETLDSSDHTHEFTYTHKVSLRPLREDLVKLWKREGYEIIGMLKLKN